MVGSRLSTQQSHWYCPA